MKKIIWLIMLMMVISVVYAQGETSAVAISKEITKLRAEVLKGMEDLKQELKDDNRAYNDENYGVLDERMRAFLRQTEKRLIIGVLGLNFFVASIFGFVYNWLNKKHSLQTFERKLKDKAKASEPKKQPLQDQNVYQQQQPYPNYEQPVEQPYMAPEQPYEQPYDQNVYQQQY